LQVLEFLEYLDGTLAIEYQGKKINLQAFLIDLSEKSA
jgi:hypothetical protein